MKKTIITDHNGNTFDSIRQLCEFWDIPRRTFLRRLNVTQSPQKAIEYCLNNKRPTRSKKSKDHLGNEFESISDMCKYYNITPSAYKDRQRKKWSLEQTLTTPLSEKKTYKDHLGNIFETQKELCEHYNITPSMYHTRLSNGYTLEQTLLNTEHQSYKPTQDHLGNTYPSTTDMCDAYKISIHTFNKRLKYHYTLEEALTKPIIKHQRNKHDDTIGNIFDSVKDMCKHYNVSIQYYYKMQQHNYSMIESLKIIPTIHPKMKPNTNIVNNLFTICHIANNYYLCTINQKEIVLHRSQIIEYAQKQLFK